MRHVNNHLQHIVLHSRPVAHHWPQPAFQIAAFLFVVHGRLRIVGHVCTDGEIRLDSARDHFRPAQPDFFLYGIDDIQRIRQFLLVLAQPPRYLGNHVAAHAVVQCTAYEVVLVQFNQLIFKHRHTTHVNAHRFYFFFILGPNVDKDILQAGCLFLAGITHVNGWPAKHTLDNPFCRMNIHPHRWRDLVIRASVAPYINVAILRDVIHKP